MHIPTTFLQQFHIITLKGVCENGAVRLVSSQGVTGVNVMEGRVEVCWNEAWGTVCDRSWTPNDAQVVCQQLRFLRSGKLIKGKNIELNIEVSEGLKRSYGQLRMKAQG